MATTLDQYLTLPQHRVLDLSRARMRGGLYETVGFEIKRQCLTPELEALEFYSLHHLVAQLLSQRGRFEKLQGLEAEAVERYVEVLRRQFQPLLAYIAFVGWREQRHRTVHDDNQLRNALKAQYPRAWPLLEVINDDTDRERLVEVWADIIDPAECTALEFVQALRAVFEGFKFKTGYGGKAWAQVVTPLVQLFSGKSTIEMFIDTAYSIAHNNGTMFNKGVIYYTPESDFTDMLDVQDAGQVPQALLQARWPLVHKLPSYLVPLVAGLWPTLNPDKPPVVETIGTLKKATKGSKKSEADTPVDFAMPLLLETATSADVFNELIAAMPKKAEYKGLYSVLPGQPPALKFVEAAFATQAESDDFPF